MSSHQLEYLQVSPHISVILNLFEDHLDHSGTINHYHENKLQIFKHQTEEDYMIYCSDNKTLLDYINNFPYQAQQFAVSKDNKNAACFQSTDYVMLNNEQVYDTKEERKLLGEHNLINIMVCLTISKILKLNMKEATKSIATFEPLEYRLQNIGTINDVT